MQVDELLQPLVMGVEVAKAERGREVAAFAPSPASRQSFFAGRWAAARHWRDRRPRHTAPGHGYRAPTPSPVLQNEWQLSGNGRDRGNSVKWRVADRLTLAARTAAFIATDVRPVAPGCLDRVESIGSTIELIEFRPKATGVEARSELRRHLGLSGPPHGDAPGSSKGWTR